MKSILNPDCVMVCLLILQTRAFITREIMVNDPLTLQCTCSENCPVVRWSRFIPEETVVAWIRVCPEKKRQEKRFLFSGDTSRGNFSLMISSVAYNDAGSYRCSCNGKSVTEVKLKVVVPSVVKAFEGENITLPCYGDTRRDVKDVKWKKAEQNVLLYTHANRSVTTGSRFSMAVEGFLDGDLSLHIDSVQTSDGGLYQCLIHDESQDGEPPAVLLKVEGLQPTTNSSGEVSLSCVLLGLIVSVGLIIFSIYIIRKAKKTK